MKQSVTISFCDFWDKFNPQDNFITNTLRSKYEVNISEDPYLSDIMFCSMFGNRRMMYDHSVLRVYFTGENDAPDFNEADYAISFHHIDYGNRHLRLPLYAIYKSFDCLRKGLVSPLDKKEAIQRDFCSVVVSSSLICDPERLRIIDELDKRHPLSFGGFYRNNIGKRVDDKLEFISKFKFNLCPENSIVEGYITEKIMEPFVAHTVPIYWGTKDVSSEFNPEAFINLYDFDNLQNAFDYVLNLDQDPDAYYKMLTAPKLTNNKHVLWETQLLEFLSNIVDNKRRYVTSYGYMGTCQQKKQVIEYIWKRKYIRQGLLKLTETQRH